jgi:hypothetical protein
MGKHIFCSDLALARGEPHVGTGALGGRILLIAWPRRLWRAKRKAAGMGPELAAAVAYATTKTPYVLFIDRTFSDETMPQLIAFPERQALDGLGEAELAAAIRLWADGGTLTGRYEARSTLICCTDSITDTCCARFGFATYKRLIATADREKFNVLQCNHIGGCRFASSLLVVEKRERYGRLAPEAVPDFLAAIAADEIYLPAWRGRGDLGEPEQVADFAARRWAERNGAGDVAIALGTSERLGPFAMRVTATVGTDTLAVTLAVREFLRHGHCHDVEKPAEVVTRWLATGVEKLEHR